LVAHWKAGGTRNSPTLLKASFQSPRMQIVLSCDVPEAISQINAAKVEKSRIMICKRL